MTIGNAAARMERQLRQFCRIATIFLILWSLPLHSVQAKLRSSEFAFEPVSVNNTERFVIAHYVPQFEVTIGDASDERGDYYERHYLEAQGENGKFLRGGGFVRERPLLPAKVPGSRGAGFDLDVARAARIGIDAFGVNLFSIDGASWRTAGELLNAAARGRNGLRVMPEPDMTVLHGVPPARLANALVLFAKHGATFRLSDGRMLVMPFGSENVPPAYWIELSRAMKKAGTPIALAMDFVNPARLEQYAGHSWAFGAWGVRTSNAGTYQLRLADKAKQAGYARWIATLAPQDMRPKDLIMTEADGASALRSAGIAAIEGGAAALHLVTWNDYSEGTEFSPATAGRYAWYDLAAWYIAWFKRGMEPPILRDAMVVLHRQQIFDPVSSRYGAPWRVVGGAPAANVIDVEAFLTADASVTIEVGGVRLRRVLPAGQHRLIVPARPGAVRVAIARQGRTLVNCRSPWIITSSPSRHDPLYAGFSTLRDCN